ncbi:hypothetical protein LO763_00145 [Glycomyces sp. A-F 0318]|uniref:hypothetical protein n=1 Tax=Glycomyces amatae TaxID=2881355 RepID=UPI001E3510DA|nr:hypothetical protein [Glycomyces amatae]MCD0442037.1 hypothetical protein [Glycomyces amatae]
MARRRTNPARRGFNGKCARVVAATLDDVKAFRTAKGGGQKPVVLELKFTPDMNKKDFNRKAKDLVRLGNQGRLKRVLNTKSLRDPKLTSKHRSDMIAKTARNHKGNPKLKQILEQFRGTEKGADGKVRPKSITHKGQIRDPDHIHELQLGGPDDVSNLRWMDAYTNRKMGREIYEAMEAAGVKEGTPIIVRLVR